MCLMQLVCTASLHATCVCLAWDVQTLIGGVCLTVLGYRGMILGVASPAFTVSHVNLGKDNVWMMV